MFLGGKIGIFARPSHEYFLSYYDRLLGLTDDSGTGLASLACDCETRCCLFQQSSDKVAIKSAVRYCESLLFAIPVFSEIVIRRSPRHSLRASDWVRRTLQCLAISYEAP